jgi:CheY-like chemotaxis protein/HPt (histidine-containing phosphotransfer) domain-containing protein
VAAAPTVQASQPEPAVRTTASLGLRVLVADDNAINREVAVAMLETLGCSAALACDGHTAVAEAQLGNVDLILMDCQMPGMDGYAATAAIRAHEQRVNRAATPIVALTANVMARDRERCLAAGMDGFLAKPFNAAQLAELLQPIAAARSASAQIESTRDVSPAESEPPSAGLAVEDASTAEPELSEEAVAAVLESPANGPETAVRLVVLDPEQVLAIRDLGKPQLFERLCESLFATASDALARIDTALAANDLEALAASAHALKSPVANLGGRRLADMLERCETLAREGADQTLLRRIATGLKPHYAALVAALQAEMRRAAAG